MSKYNAKAKIVNGIRFASTKEGERYKQLLLLEKGGVIQNLSLQPKFKISINDAKICNYIADFQYIEGGKVVVEDVKGIKTPVYKLKKKMFEAVYGGDYVHRET